MIFSVTPGKTVIITSAIVTLIMLGCILFCFSTFIDQKSILSLVVGIVLILVFILAYAYCPQSYTIEKNQLIIKRIAGDVVIPKSAVKSVNIIHREIVRDSIRTFGVGGLFGYYGKFTNSKFGVMKWYIRRMDQLVMLTTSTGEFLLSPDDFDGFVSALN
jgi:hypothetical protein